SAHAPAADSGTPVPTSGGTFNLTQTPSSCLGSSGHLVSKPDCLTVNGNLAWVTAHVTHATGVYASLYLQKVEIALEDVPDMIGFFDEMPAQCSMRGSAYSPVVHGNINIHDE